MGPGKGVHVPRDGEGPQELEVHLAGKEQNVRGRLVDITLLPLELFGLLHEPPHAKPTLCPGTPKVWTIWFLSLGACFRNW